MSGMEVDDTRFIGDISELPGDLRTCSGVSEGFNRSMLMRADKFSALAHLFNLDISGYGEAVEILLVPCDDAVSCAMNTAGIREAGRAALAWVENVSSIRSVRAEHLRLFGSPDQVRRMPIVSPLASMYATGSGPDVVSLVEQEYARWGFVPECDGAWDCPTHISHELEFVAHCLRSAVDGSKAECGARSFVAEHLSAWGVLFSAAVYGRSHHPVTKFGGLTLEHLLLCEAERARVHRRVGRG